MVVTPTIRSSRKTMKEEEAEENQQLHDTGEWTRTRADAGETGAGRGRVEATGDLNSQRSLEVDGVGNWLRSVFHVLVFLWAFVHFCS